MGVSEAGTDFETEPLLVRKNPMPEVAAKDAANNDGKPRRTLPDSKQAKTRLPDTFAVPP